MGSCLGMAFLINKQILIVSCQCCLKGIVLICVGASFHFPSLLFPTAWTAMSLAALAPSTPTTAFSNSLVTFSAPCAY